VALIRFLPFALVLALIVSACGEGVEDITGPQTGTIVVTATSSGPEPDPDGYLFAVDGGAPQPIGVSASSSLANVAPGSHTVFLSGLAANCTMSSANPQTVTVTAAASATASFAVQCSAPGPTTGSVRLVTATGGSSPDSDGFIYSLDGGTEQPIGANATTLLESQSAGSHSILLAGIATNCTLAGENPRTFNVTAGAQSDVTFTLTCAAPAQLRWTRMESGTDHSLAKVWGLTGDDVYVTENWEIWEDTEWKAAIRHYNGTSWTQQARFDGLQLLGIWGSAPNDIFAVGWSPLGFICCGGEIVHFDGNEWSLMETGLDESGLEIRSVWGSSGSSVLTVGGSYDAGWMWRIFNYDGTTWAAFSPASHQVVLNDVSGSSGQDVFAVGEFIERSNDYPPMAVTYHYDGTAWTGQEWGPENTGLRGVWSASATAVFAVGMKYVSATPGPDSFIWRYDGSTWTEMETPNVGRLEDVWGSSATDVYAVGQRGILHYDGTSWTVMQESAQPLSGIWGISPDNLFAVGAGGTILHGTR
jgi:hypothetical protein